MKDLNKLTISPDATLKEAIKAIDNAGIGLVCVVDGRNKLIGIITDGDFRRSILNDISLNEKVIVILNNNFKYLEKGYTRESVQKLFNESAIRHIPVLDNGELVEVITEEDFFGIKTNNSANRLDCHVVIMAGGKGTRLDPITRIMPKPLIPIGDKAMIEIIIDEFRKYSINEFYISINYKKNMIKAFFEDKTDDLIIKFIEEDKPLGTAGALKKLEGEISKPVFLINCDILIKADYKSIYDFHRNGKYDLTIVASLQNYQIPYGVCKIQNGGQLKELIEKPEYDFFVNTGMYVLEPAILKYIPADEFFHITQLIVKLKKHNFNIGVYPVSEKSWIDVGQFAEYLKFIEE